MPVDIPLEEHFCTMDGVPPYVTMDGVPPLVTVDYMSPFVTVDDMFPSSARSRSTETNAT